MKYTMNRNNIVEKEEDEDEDVIVKDSLLYKYLHESGYTDFESTTIEKLPSKTEEKKHGILDFLHNVKHVFKKLYAVYLKMIQGNGVSKRQIEAILNSKVLLSDHGSAIYNVLEKYDCEPQRIMGLKKFVLLGSILSPPLYISHNTRFESATSLFLLAVLCSAVYMEYARLNDRANLNSVVSLQNDLSDLCKKGMRILKYGYKIKLSKGKAVSQQFSDLTAGRLKYLQPLMETLVKHFEHVSYMYHRVSLILLRLLPEDNSKYQHASTNLRDSSFCIRGEINYQKLKNLYYTFILTQSEMLHLLAIAYDNYTWSSQSYERIPEFKLARILRTLITVLIIYKEKLLETIDAYYNFKLELIPCKRHIGPDSTQWQDLYMHLYLACNKLQSAYSDVSSVLRDIDDDATQPLDIRANENRFETNTLQRLSTARKSVEAVKDFLEYSSLFLTKRQTTNHRVENNGYGSDNNRLEAVTVNTDNVRTVTTNDWEPETIVMDEVFEEYIKEEYLKSDSCGNSEEAEAGISLYNYKRDKMLFKNFMTELKDALVDKKKSMSERESRALRRMYKFTMKEPQRIPTPPPMPTFDSTSSIESGDEDDDQISRMDEPRPYKFSQDVIGTGRMTAAQDDQKRNEEVSIPSSQNDVETLRIAVIPRNLDFSFIPPSSFLKAEEETFIGSGENSEDDETIEEQTG